MGSEFNQDGNNVYSIGANSRKMDPANENHFSAAAGKPGKAAMPVKPAARAAVSAEKPPAKGNGETDNPGIKLEFTSESMMNGIILSELLGKPKILQKRRW